jgi:hypothetical protein
LLFAQNSRRQINVAGSRRGRAQLLLDALNGLFGVYDVVPNLCADLNTLAQP